MRDVNKCSMALSDKENRVSLGFAPGRMENDVFGEERTNNIVKAFVESIEDL